jgi:tungstate transport system substrate-binding protein
MRLISRLLLLVMLAAPLAALTAPAPAAADTNIVLASTTSTENTGLFKVLIPAYYKWTKLKDVRIHVVAVGTGKAIEIATRGDADLLLVHDRVKEDAFVKAGYGVDRRNVMYNDFIITGPKDDPAGIKSAKSAADAFRKIVASGAVFVSRGDESGTEAREKLLWKAAGIPVPVKNYLSVGQGMEETLRIADEKQAYTLSDRSTYRTLLDRLKYTTLLYQGDPGLFNQYGTIAVNPKKFPHTHYKEAEDFMNFITGPDGQKVIGNYEDKTGTKLFHPDASK